MSICLNALQVSAPAETTERILLKGFEKAENDDWGPVMEQFSFVPFVSATDQKLLASHFTEIDSLWTNWIEAIEIEQSNSDAEYDQLTIEFESHDEAPVYVIKAFIAWLEQEKLAFHLSYRSKQEGDAWQQQLQVDDSDASMLH